MMEANRLWFREKSKLVYPGYGVGTVTGFEDRSVRESVKTFVVISFADAENVSIVRIPLDNVNEVGLRPISAPDATTEALSFLEGGEPEIQVSWKDRFATHGELLAAGDLLSVAKVLKALWILNTRKPLSFREKKMYQRALLLMSAEVAEAKNMTRKESEDLILDSLNKAHPYKPPK